MNQMVNGELASQAVHYHSRCTTWHLHTVRLWTGEGLIVERFGFCARRFAFISCAPYTRRLEDSAIGSSPQQCKLIRLTVEGPAAEHSRFCAPRPLF